MLIYRTAEVSLVGVMRLPPRIRPVLPAVASRLFGRRRWVVEVFTDDRCAADMDFPDLPARDDFPVLVSELNEHPDHRLTDGSDLSPLVFRTQIRHQADLGCAVELVETRVRKPR